MRLADTYGIFPDKKTKRKTVRDGWLMSSVDGIPALLSVQDWASFTAGQARLMGLHAMKLARSPGSRLSTKAYIYRETRRSEKVMTIKNVIREAIRAGPVSTFDSAALAASFASRHLERRRDGAGDSADGGAH